MRDRRRATLLGLGLVLTLAAASAIVFQNNNNNNTTTPDSTSTSRSPDDSAPGPDIATDTVPATAPSVVTTAQPEPTTTVVLSGVDAEVHAATLGYYEYYWKCLRAPAGCEPGRVTVEGSAAFDDMTDVARTLLQNGLFVGAEESGNISIESIAVEGDRATIDTCWWTTAVLYLQSPVQGDPPLAQDTPPTSGHQVYDFVRDPTDGVWRVERADQIDDLTENVNQCATE